MTRLALPPLLAVLLAVLVVEGAVAVTYESRPSYYWSRARGGTSRVSLRSSHIGPLPRVNDVMMEWSTWGPWARCSRSCGGGVKSRSRTCVTRYPRVMPGSGVRTSHDQCGGESVEYRVCGASTCPPNQVSALSFRAAQCRHYNSRRVFGRVVNNWVPYMQGGINPCALVCEGEGQGLVYTFGKVTDGTHCSSSGRDGLCVNGRCMPLSCDGRLGGRVQEDMCRVCGGNNDTCTHHVGIFHTDLPAADQPQPTTAAAHSPHTITAHLPPQPPKPRSLGYYEVTSIPRGATNVRVKDTSANFLALKAGSKYLLNGDWLIDWPGEVDAGGTTFTYTRREDETESLTSLGPTSQDLTLMVLLREHNPGIHYEYWTPNNDPRLAPLTPAVVTQAPTTTTTTTTIITPTTTSPTTATTTTTTPRPAVITSVNATKTKHHRPANVYSETPGRPSHSGESSQPSATTTTTTTPGRPQDESSLHHPSSRSSSQGFVVSVAAKSSLCVTTTQEGRAGESHRSLLPPASSSTTTTTTPPRRHDNESHKTPLSRHKPGKPRKRGRGEGGRRGGRRGGIRGRGRGLIREKGRGGIKEGRRRGGGKQTSEGQNSIRGNRKRKKKRRKKPRKDEEDKEEEVWLKKEKAEETRARVGGRRRGQKKGGRMAGCGPCPRMRRRTKQMFCTSDFVSQVKVLSREEVSGEVRYEVLVHQSYKNTVPLLHKEFLWVPDPCQCPRLRPGLTYLVMGTTEVARGREVRLILPRHSYVRRFKPKQLARILRVRHNEMRFCRPWRRDLSFLLPPPPTQQERQHEEQGKVSLLQEQSQEHQRQDQTKGVQQQQQHTQVLQQESQRQGYHQLLQDHQRLDQEQTHQQHQHIIQDHPQLDQEQGYQQHQHQDLQDHQQEEECRQEGHQHQHAGQEQESHHHQRLREQTNTTLEREHEPQHQHQHLRRGRGREYQPHRHQHHQHPQRLDQDHDEHYLREQDREHEHFPREQGQGLLQQQQQQQQQDDGQEYQQHHHHPQRRQRQREEQYYQHRQTIREREYNNILSNQDK